MANTGWINASNAYVSFIGGSFIDDNNTTDSSFETTFINANGGSAYMIVVINNALISNGTINSVTIKYTCQSSSKVNALQSALTARTGYIKSDGGHVWTTTHTKAMGGSNQSPTPFEDPISNPTRSSSGDYRFLIGAVNPIKANTPYATFTNISIYIDYTPPHTHSYTSTVTKQPTCTATGVRTYTCSCGDSYTEVIPATGHTEVTIPAVAPTCTATGLTEGKKCSVCGTIITAQQTVAALGHSWNATTYTWSADGKSCTAQRVCSRDSSHKETATATITSAVKTAATCTDKGTTTYTAKFSVSWATTQTKDVQDISAKGHTWIDATCTAPKTCSVCGVTEGSALGHSPSCYPEITLVQILYQNKQISADNKVPAEEYFRIVVGAIAHH